MMNGEISGYAHYLQTAYCIPKRVQFLLYVQCIQCASDGIEFYSSCKHQNTIT